MNPNVGQPQNPFIGFLQKLQSQGAPQAPGQNNPMLQAMMAKQQSPAGTTPGGAPVGMQGGQGSGLPGTAAAAQPQMQDAALPGQNPGTTKQLLGAMSQLHAVITQLTDPQEIRMIRSIIILLNQLIQRDQQVQNGNTGRFSQGQPQQGGTIGGPGGMPTGQPAGAPNPAQ